MQTTFFHTYTKRFFAIFGVAVVLSLIFAAGCDDCADTEVSRTTSPDGRVDAVMAERNCGAASSFAYRVFLAPRGQKITGEPLFVADHVSNLNIRWENPHQLVITYSQANIHGFVNYWSISEGTGNDPYAFHEVRIREMQQD